MIKKIIILLLTSSLISAGLLFLGITMMGQYTPALASSLNALVAGTNVQNSPGAISAGSGGSLAMDQSGEKAKLQVYSKPNSPALAPSLGAPAAGTNVQNSPTAVPIVGGDSLAMDQGGVKQKPEAPTSQKSVSSIPVSSSQPLKAPFSSTSGAIPITDITIAQLFSNPDQYIEKVITIIGIATRLSNNQFLLNDGTGQILVGVELVPDRFAIINGLIITVMGKLDESSSQSGLHLDAYTLTDQNGTVVINDSKEDSSSMGDHDCSIDNCIDDCKYDNCSDDCKYDNCIDDCKYDNCSDDCKYDNCSDDCKYDNCSDDCKYDNCSDDCKNDDCIDDREVDSREYEDSD